MDKKTSESEDLNIDIDFEELLAIDDSSDGAIAKTLRNASSAGSAAQASRQKEALQAVMDSLAPEVNRSAIAKSTGLPVKTNSAQNKGFVAEENHKLTLKINALAKGVPDWKLGAYTNGELSDGTVLSRIDTKTDIVIETRKWPWSKPVVAKQYQSKMHNNPSDYKKDFSDSKYQDVEHVGGAGQGVNDTISVKIGRKTIHSDPITPKGATALADQAKAQATPAYQKSAEKHSELDRVNLGRAVAAGAATQMILGAVREIIFLIKNRDSLPEDQFIKSVAHILADTAEGAIRGGAIMGSVQLLGKIVGKEIAANTLGAVPSMVIASAAVDFAKDIYRCFVSGIIDADDMLCNTVNNTFTSFAGYGGAWALGAVVSAKTATATGAAIGSALGPIGTIVGSVVGGIVIGRAANMIVGVANKDAVKAYNECIAEICTHIELDVCGQLYYFADAISNLSELQLSFKNLLPCYNLISDLKEYSLRKKAIKRIHEQFETKLQAAELAALRTLEEEHRRKIEALQAGFRDQREAMHDDFKKSMDTYAANSYAQYISMFDIYGDIEGMKAALDRQTTIHNAILAYARNRNEANQQLNETLAELMEDREAAYFVYQFVDKIKEFMQQDESLKGRQYISFDEALYLVRGRV